MVYLIKLVEELLAGLRKNLESPPGKFGTLDVAKVLGNAMDSMRASAYLATGILPSNELCGEKVSKEFWNLHSALLFYYYDALMLLKHSILSAFTGYYSVASTELRCAMESVVGGVIFDLLAMPSYRRMAVDENTGVLRRVKGFQGAPGFAELLRVLEEKLGDKRPEVSVEIFDIINSELRDFNPEAGFIKLLVQLKNWGIIDDELFKYIDPYYTELSKLSHRVHPNLSETGLRIIADKDWLALEPVPDELYTYLYNFADLNGVLTYLVLKVLSLDLEREDFRKRINWPGLEEAVELISELAKHYGSWKKVEQLLNKLKQSNVSASGIHN